MTEFNRLNRTSVILLVRRLGIVKKPILRVTKWLRDIPVEAQCTHCPDVSFKANASSHRPNRQEYQNSLQAQFDAHYEAMHSEEFS